MAINLSRPYTSAMITVPDNTLANKRNDNEIGIAISLIMLIGAHIGSHGAVVNTYRSRYPLRFDA